MEIGVVTLFPELVKTVTEHGVVAKACSRGTATLHCWNPRDYAKDRHRTVDDRPYGGGPGMLMQVGPLQSAIGAARDGLAGRPKVVYLSPQRKTLVQQDLRAGQSKEVWYWCVAGTKVLMSVYWS